MDQMESKQRIQCDPRPGTTDLYGNLRKHQGFPGGSVRKEPACNAGDAGSIPGWGSPPEKGTVTHSRILTWEIPWVAESGGVQSMESQENCT